MTPRLTLNAGLRWEPWLPFQELNGSIYNFSESAMIAGVKSTKFNNAPPGLTFPGDPGFQGTSGMNKDFALFAPRVALGYDPKGDGKMVIRASWGISYDFVSGEFWINAADAPPYGGTEIFGRATRSAILTVSGRLPGARRSGRKHLPLHGRNANAVAVCHRLMESISLCADPI